MSMTDDTRELLRHFLAALAYRTQKAVRDAPDAFGAFQVAPGVRTPAGIIRHMTGLLGYARTYFVGGQYRPDELPSFRAEIVRFHEMLEDLARHLDSGKPLRDDMSPATLLQGPLADAMTHAGQLALLRRLAGSPVAPEDFSAAAIDSKHLGPDQPHPARPETFWPEAPTGWRPPGSGGAENV